MKIKAVIFDYDGVIVNSLKIVFEVYKAISRKLNKVEFQSPEQLSNSFDGDWRKLYEKMGVNNKAEERIATDTYASMLFESVSKIPVIPGMSEAIHTLAGKYKMGIVTNTQKGFIVDKLKQFNLTEFFTSIVDWYDTKKRKPEPDQIMECMRQLGASPEETIYIGDMDGDMIAGQRAGVKVIGVTWGWHNPEKLKAYNPYAMVSTPEELLAAIEKA